MQLKEIKFTPKSSANDLSDNLIYKCNNCQKNVVINQEKKHILEKLSGSGFYCSFCLSNNYQTKNGQNILILSFRSVFGYYYLNFFKSKTMYLCEIEDYIKNHEKIGIKNPVFKYDPQTMLWFIDFARIGKGKKRVSLNEVIQTIEEIILSFTPCNKINGYKIDKFKEKYIVAVKKFYEDRYRPSNRRILIPSMSGCVYNTEKISFEETKKLIEF